MRPYMESHGGDVEMLGLEDDVARLRLQGSCDGCPASAGDPGAGDQVGARGGGARPAVGLEVEGLEDPHQRAARRSPGTELPVIQSRRRATGRRRRGPAWHDLDGELDGLAEGSLTGDRGRRHPELIVAKVDGSMLAYLDACARLRLRTRRRRAQRRRARLPGLRAPLLPAPGRALARRPNELLLDPVPLLGSEGRIRVAIPR